METSALMALADFRGAEVGLVLTVSDHVFDTAWPNIFKTDTSRGTWRRRQRWWSRPRGFCWVVLSASEPGGEVRKMESGLGSRIESG